jgi:hypothetical protein
MYQYESEPSP